jgi:hypothetical protein
VAFSSRWRRYVFALCLAAYFLYFGRAGLTARWAPDDMMNLAGYWQPGPWRALWSLVRIWSHAYRPMGAVFYLPLYHLFGLNPLPFHVVDFVVLGVNVWLFYRLARLLGAEEAVAGVSAVPMAYHAGLAALFFSTAMVYDVLCCFFYLSALIYYLRLRARGELPRGRHLAAFVALFVCALNSKEMAVTLPPLLLAYEWLYHAPETWKEGGWRNWIWKQNRAALIGIVLNLIYIGGHMFGRDPMMSWPAYRPHISLAQAIDFHSRTLAVLFYRPDPLGAGTLAALAIAVTYAAWRRRRPDLRFYWFWIVLTPLPIEFLRGRGGSADYVPLVGWSLLAGTLFIEMAGALAAWLHREPLFARVRQPLLRMALIGAGLAAFAAQTRYLHTFIAAELPRIDARTWSAIQQLHAIGLKPRPHDRIVFLNDPFTGWDMLFIAELTFRDRSLEWFLQNKSHLSPDTLAGMEHILAFDKGKLVLLK